MERMCQEFTIGDLTLRNRFVFPPVKLGYGNPDGTVTDRQVTFYRQIAENGPGLMIVEPASVTPDGREHPKQVSIHHPESALELKKIVNVIHGENRLACLHLNHAGAAANPKVIGGKPKAPSSFICPTTEQEAIPLSAKEIRNIVFGYRDAAKKGVEAGFVKEARPDLLVWATGAVQNIPEISGLKDQHVMTAIEYFRGEKEVKGPRVLVIGASRTGIEIAEKLGREGYDVVATKRTDPIGSMMEMITKKLDMMRIGQMKKITLMPHTTVKAFHSNDVEMEKDGETVRLKPFQTVILSSGMLSAKGPDEKILNLVPKIETIGDAKDV